MNAGTMRDGQVAEYIQQLVAAAPPFTAEQRDKLVVLLRPGAA